MSRILTPEFAAALSDSTVYPIILYEGEFASGTIRLWTGVGVISWNDKTWIGGSNLVGISPMEEVLGTKASGASVSMSGVPIENISLAIQEAKQGLIGVAYFGLLTESGLIIANPIEMFVGRLDVPEISIDGETVTVKISYENKMTDMKRTREFRYTHESQKALFPDDEGFSFVAGLQDATVVWGKE